MVSPRQDPKSKILHPASAALAAVLREWRLAAGLSLYEIWKRSGVARETVRRIELLHGSFEMETAIRICEAMGRRFEDAVVEALRRFRGEQAAPAGGRPERPV